MTNSEAMDVLRIVLIGAMLQAKEDPTIKEAVDRFGEAVAHIADLLSRMRPEYEEIKLAILVGRVARKLQIGMVDARSMVFEALDENATASIVCGLLLEIEE